MGGSTRIGGGIGRDACASRAGDHAGDDGAPTGSLDELAQRHATPGHSRVQVIALPADGARAAAEQALARAAIEGRDLLLVSPGVTPGPGAVEELAAGLAADPMAGFVAPRAVNAPAAAAALRRLAPQLPRFATAPLPPPGCLLLRATMAAEFGPLDPAIEELEEALADLVLRANRCGHRVLVAQRAFAARKPGAPPAPEPARLAGRHPSLPRALARQAAAAAAEALLAPLAAERPSVLFACDHLLPMHYGTAELVRPSIAAFAARHGARHEVLVSGEPAALAFHGLDRLPGVEAITPAEAARRAPFAAAFRLCQPHRLGDLAALGRLAALPGIVMLDTIALDCQHLDEADLGPLYAAMPDAVVMLGAISAAALAQAERRIPLPAGLTRFVMPLSAAPAEYARGEGPRPPGLPPPGYLLLVGNGYAHKHLAPTLAALRAAALERPVVVLGAAVEEGAAWSAASGALSDAVVGALYAGAAAVLYPSHHEGFGLPLMHALAHRRPILARDLPSAREVRARAGAAGANIHLGTDTAALVRLACDPPGWVEAAPGAAAGEGWAAAGDALAAALAAAREQLDLASLERRLARLAWLEGWLAAGRIPALERELAAARASRAAELSARLAAAEARASAAEAKASAVQAQLARLAAHPVWSVTRALRRVPAAAATGRLLLGLLRRTRARGDGPA